MECAGRKFHAKQVREEDGRELDVAGSGRELDVAGRGRRDRTKDDEVGSGMGERRRRGGMAQRRLAAHEIHSDSLRAG
eukprot:755182-Hanusia_phi.AAC.2